MFECRVQGRPARGGKEVGRGKIIENLQAMLRSRDRDDLSRKTVARYSGVTPALITYYFPNRKSLIEEATKPVIEDYYRRLVAILRSDAQPADRLRQVISLLITCYSRDGGILNAYKEFTHSEQINPGDNLIDLMSNELTVFFNEWIGGQSNGMRSAELLQSAVWGMCEFVARETAVLPANSGASPAGPGVSETELSFLLFKLFTNGLNCWPPDLTLDKLAHANA